MKIEDLKKYPALHAAAVYNLEKYIQVCRREKQQPVVDDFTWAKTKEGHTFWEYVEHGDFMPAMRLHPNLFEIEVNNCPHSAPMEAVTPWEHKAEMLCATSLYSGYPKDGKVFIDESFSGYPMAMHISAEGHVSHFMSGRSVAFVDVGKYSGEDLITAATVEIRERFKKEGKFNSLRQIAKLPMLNDPRPIYEMFGKEPNTPECLAYADKFKKYHASFGLDQGYTGPLSTFN